LQSGATSGLDTIKNRRNGDINIETEELLPKGQRDRIGAISAAMLSSSIRKVKFIVFIAHIIYICGLSAAPGLQTRFPEYAPALALPATDHATDDLSRSVSSTWHPRC
jgi:hypothetical protein